MTLVKMSFAAVLAMFSVVPAAVSRGEPAKADPTRCAIFFPTGYSVSVSEYRGACTPARTLWLRQKIAGTIKDVAELSFWKDSEAPVGVPIITQMSGVFHADMMLSDFEVIYKVLKSEKSVMVVFQCDGHGGYKGIHFSGGNDAAKLREFCDKLLELQTHQTHQKERTCPVVYAQEQASKIIPPQTKLTKHGTHLVELDIEVSTTSVVHVIGHCQWNRTQGANPVYLWSGVNVDPKDQNDFRVLRQSMEYLVLDSDKPVTATTTCVTELQPGKHKFVWNMDVLPQTVGGSIVESEHGGNIMIQVFHTTIGGEHIDTLERLNLPEK